MRGFISDSIKKTKAWRIISIITIFILGCAQTYYAFTAGKSDNTFYLFLAVVCFGWVIWALFQELKGRKGKR